MKNTGEGTGLIGRVMSLMVPDVWCYLGYRFLGFGECLELVISKEGKIQFCFVFLQVEELGVEVALSKDVGRIKHIAGSFTATECIYLCAARDHNLIVWFTCDGSGPGFEPSSS